MTITSYSATSSPIAPAQTSPDPAKSAQATITLGSFAAVMAAQGQALGNPLLALALHSPGAGQTASSATVSGQSGSGPVSGPPTAAQIATRIVNEIGDNGTITLAQAETALDQAKPGYVANSRVNIDEDFRRLSGGGDVLTTGQLTASLQSYMDQGGFSGKMGSGRGLVVNGVLTGPTLPSRG